jgi:acyl-CoA-binding protein
LRSQFDAAAEYFGQMVSRDPSRVPDATKLRCYGLYKQATAGDAPRRGSSVGVPPWWQPWFGAAASKWRAWSAVRGTDEGRAMEMYMAEVRRAAPEWDGVFCGGGGGGGGGNKGGPGGAVFSRPAAADDNDPDHLQSLHELAGKGEEAAIVAHLDGVARRAAGAAGAADDAASPPNTITAAAALLASASSSSTCPPHLRAAADAVRSAIAARDADGATPLHFAADRGREGAVRLLCAHYGADPSAGDGDGSTPLHYAAAGGHEACSAVLLSECGANAELRDSEGLTAREMEGAADWECWRRAAAAR